MPFCTSISTKRIRRNPLNLNLCSKCYKDYLSNKEKEEQHQAAAVGASAAAQKHVTPNEPECEAMDTEFETGRAVGTAGDASPTDVGSAERPEQQQQQQQQQQQIATPTCPFVPSSPTPTKLRIEQKDMTKSEAEAKASVSTPPPPPPLATPEGARTPAVAAGAADDGGKERRVQKNTSRCMECNKKIGLTGFKCRCGYFYCATHRHSDAHNCDYDYKSAGRAELAKANPLVVADKVTRI